MKIVTWNINGLRSFKTPISTILKDFDADIVCFQETKISRNLLPEETAFVEGYSSYFSFSRKQSGYSGVAIYCKETCTPENSNEGLSSILQSNNKSTFVLDEDLQLDELIQPSDIYDLDSEGRAIITYHKIKCNNQEKNLAVINVYCPRVDPEKPERHLYKINFLNLLKAKAKALSNNNSYVIVIGDMNISHTMIDHCDPGNEEIFIASDARVWLTSFLNSPCNHSCPGNEFVDTFRYFHPLEKEAYTCWSSRTGGRETNYGTRIDYILANCLTIPYVESCEILSDVYGSDHCPVMACFKFEAIPAKKPPSLCTRFYPEFSGKQQKLITFLQENTSLNHKHKSYPEIDVPLKKAKTESAKSNTNKQRSIFSFISVNQKKGETSVLKNEPIQPSLKELDNCMLTADSSFIESQNVYESISSVNQIKQNISENQNNSKSNASSQSMEKWKNLLSGPPKPPLCKGHNKVCALRTVKKSGVNYGRQFYCCPQPEGPATNPESRCNYFQWIETKKKK